MLFNQLFFTLRNILNQKKYMPSGVMHSNFSQSFYYP